MGGDKHFGEMHSEFSIVQQSNHTVSIRASYQWWTFFSMRSSTDDGCPAPALAAARVSVAGQPLPPAAAAAPSDDGGKDPVDAAASRDDPEPWCWCVLDMGVGVGTLRA